MQGGEHRVRRRLAQSAERIFFQIIAELFQTVDVLQGAVAAGDLIEDFQQAARTNAARGTLSTGFIHGEFQEELRDVHHTGGVVHDNQAAGTHHGADGDQVVVIDRHIHLGGRDTAAGRAAGLGCLKGCLLYTSPSPRDS